MDTADTYARPYPDIADRLWLHDSSLTGIVCPKRVLPYRAKRMVWESNPLSCYRNLLSREAP